MQRDEVDRIGLSEKDRCLVQLYIAASASQWSSLPSFAKAFYSAEGTAEELRGCLRHLIVYVMPSIFTKILVSAFIYIEHSTESHVQSCWLRTLFSRKFNVAKSQGISFIHKKRRY